MTRTALLLSCMLAGPAHADWQPDRVSVLMGTHHAFEIPMTAALTGDHDWTEVNPGVFLTWEGKHDAPLGALDWSVGAYRNSFGDLSIAAVASLDLIEWEARGGGALGVFAGLAHYPDTGQHFAVHWGDVVPLGGVQLRQGNLFVQVLPGKFEPLSPIVSFGLTFDLNPTR